MLENMADRLEGREREIASEPEDTAGLLEQVCGGCSALELDQLPEHIRSFVLLLRKIEGVTRSLAEEIATG
jgi:hypothetical protein